MVPRAKPAGDAEIADMDEEMAMIQAELARWSWGKIEAGFYNKFQQVSTFKYYPM